MTISIFGSANIDIAVNVDELPDSGKPFTRAVNRLILAAKVPIRPLQHVRFTAVVFDSWRWLAMTRLADFSVPKFNAMAYPPRISAPIAIVLLAWL